MVRSFDAKTDHRLLYRRLGVCANNVLVDDGSYQLSLFTDYEALEKERKIQQAMLKVRQRYGPGAVFKGMNLKEGATTLERNQQIGGHRA
jgi:DNA polymerase V